MATNGNEQQTQAHGITVRDIVAVLFRRKWIILGVFAVTTGVTAGFILSQPTFWESTGKVLVKRGSQDNLLQTYRRTLSWEEELSSEVETAKSPEVIKRARRVLDERRKASGQEPYSIDPMRVEAAVVGESNVLALSYQDLIPEICTEVTDALLTAYTEFRQETHTLPYPEEFFNFEIDKVKGELEELQNERRNFLLGANIVDVGNERVNILTQRSHAKAKVSGLEAEIAESNSNLDQMYRYQKNPSNYPDVPFVASQFQGNELVISNVKSQMVEKKMRHAELSRIYKPGVPELQRLEREIASLKLLLAEEVNSRIRLAEMERQTQQVKLDDYLGTVQDMDSRLALIPHQETRLADFDRRIYALNEKYKDLVRNSGQAKINQATSLKQTVFVIAPASVAYPKNSKDYVRIALAPIFSLIVGLGLAFFVDSLDTTVRNPREAEDHFDLPVLATLTEKQN